MGARPVVRLTPPAPGPGAPEGPGRGRAGGRDGADVPLPGAAGHPVYSVRMGNNDVFAVIADKTRRGILTALKDGERPVGDLVDELGVSQPTVSKHLKILREAGMVSMEAQGQRRLYAVQPEPLAEVTAWVHEVVGGAAREAPVPAPAPGTAATAGGPGAADTADTAGTPGPVTDPVPEGEPVDAGAASVPTPAAAPAPVPAAPAGTPARPSRGAGARAADILSSLSGLRRRTRNPRR